MKLNCATRRRECLRKVRPLSDALLHTSPEVQNTWTDTQANDAQQAKAADSDHAGEAEPRDHAAAPAPACEPGWSVAGSGSAMTTMDLAVLIQMGSEPLRHDIHHTGQRDEAVG